MLARIWTQNKKFILVVGSSLALFLILNSCIGGYMHRADGPKGLGAKSAMLQRDIRRLQKELAGYSEVKSLLQAYEREENTLRADLELPQEKEMDAFDEATPIRQFDQAVYRVWNDARQKANQANVPLPEKLDVRDFGVERQDGRTEYRRHYAYLGILRRALNLLINSGMTEIGRPELLEPDSLPVLAGD